MSWFWIVWSDSNLFLFPFWIIWWHVSDKKTSLTFIIIWLLRSKYGTSLNLPSSSPFLAEYIFILVGVRTFAMLRLTWEERPPIISWLYCAACLSSHWLYCAYNFHLFFALALPFPPCNMRGKASHNLLRNS